MNKIPIVSIVMPAYNSAAYISETLDSVLQQTYNDWELIIVNDCSTDSTAALVETYQARDGRISLINLTKNFGAPAGPRNIGIQHARGQWVAFLDSDDIWHPEKLSRQLAALKLYDSQFCSTQMTNFQAGETPKLRDATKSQVEWISFQQQLIKFRTPTSSVVASRYLLLRHPFNEDIAFKAREDLDCWLHCHEDVGRSVKITSPMMGYRVITGQISGKKWLMFKRHLHVLRNYRFSSGRLMYFPEAFFYTSTHFLTAIYYRLVRSGL